MRRATLRSGLIVGIFALSAYGQAPIEGRWTGYMVSPVGRLVDINYIISSDADGVRGMLDWEAGRFEMLDLVMDEDTVSFAWQGAEDLLVRCRARRGSGAAYVGGCKDQDERIGGVLMTPPGTTPTPTALDERLAFDVWGEDFDLFLKQETLRTKGRAAYIDEQIREAKPDGRIIRVGNASYNVHLSGDGPVTVVFESDLGEDLRVWNEVIRHLKGRVRVLAYDRAGLGYSDGSGWPTSLDALANELSDVLSASGVEGPFLLVGHAFGSLIVRRYAELHPGDVAGLVLAHPTDERQGAVWRGVDAESWKRYWAAQHTLHEQLSEPVRREFEVFASVIDRASILGSQGALDKPTIVLTGTRVTDPPRWVGETDSGMQVLTALHEQAASADLAQAHRLIGDSGPHIPREAPKAIATAVLDLLAIVSK